MAPMPPVYLHGFTGTPASWDPVLNHLPPSWHGSRPVLPGHGDEVPARRSFTDQCTDIAQTLAPNTHLVGYSLGARLALGTALRLASPVHRLTLIGVNPGLETGAARRERAEADNQWEALLRNQGIDAFVEAWERQPIFVAQGHGNPEALAAQRLMRRAHNPHGLAACLRDTGLAWMPNLWPDLPHLAIAVHLIVGADDAKFIAIAQRMAEQLPNATLTMLPACGHNPLVDAPAALAQALARYP